MENNETPNPKEDLSNSDTPMDTPVEQIEKTANNTQSANKGKKDATTPQNKAIRATIKQIKNGWKAITGKKSIAILGILINGTLALYSYKLFEVATEQTELAYKNSEQDSIWTEKFNEPYLQITDLRISRFKIDEPLEFTYSVDNIGNYPTKITDNKYLIGYVFYDTTMTPINNIDIILKEATSFGNYKKTTTIKSNIYSCKGINTPPFSYQGSIILSQEYFNRITTGEVKIYFWIEAIFINPINNKHKKMTYLAIFDDWDNYIIAQNDQVNVP